MKHVLIISPHFPPINAADMHRVRQTLPYLAQEGWKATVIACATKTVETDQDPLLLETVPDNIEIIHVPAFSTTWTRKLGLGSLALRSLYFYWKTVNSLLKKGGIDLIYFSTTQFPLLILGNYWKKRFGVPYIIDMQDPWHSDYYQNKPKHEQPPKYWFSYRLNKGLEPIAMKQVDALIAVSGAYIDTLRMRYPHLRGVPGHTLTFGAFERDFEILESQAVLQTIIKPAPGTVNMVYIGRAGHDMRPALSLLFEAIRRGLQHHPDVFGLLRLYFIGTSYARHGQGQKTVEPLAGSYGLTNRITEITDRLPYFTALKLMREADVLLITGSDDPQYTASKIYPYILARKPMLALFHHQSSAVQVLQDTRSAEVITFGGSENREVLVQTLVDKLYTLLKKLPFTPDTDWMAFKPHTAEAKTKAQVAIFESILQKKAQPV